MQYCLSKMRYDLIMVKSICTGKNKFLFNATYTLGRKKSYQIPFKLFQMPSKKAVISMAMVIFAIAFISRLKWRLNFWIRLFYTPLTSPNTNSIAECETPNTSHNPHQPHVWWTEKRGYQTLDGTLRKIASTYLICNELL